MTMSETLPRPGYWQPEPGVCDVVDGIPGRVAALKALGNAIVPQAAQVIGHAIYDAEVERHTTGRLPDLIVRPEHLQRVRSQ